MFKIFLFRTLLPFIALIGSTACTQKKTWPNYAQEAYLEQRARMLTEPKPPNVDQESKDDLIVEVEPSEYDPMWHRKNFETIEQWLERINILIQSNQEIIQVAQNEMEDVQAKNRLIQDQMQDLSRQSQIMKQQLLDPEKLKQDVTIPKLVKGLPFLIHLVEEGETLFSIANRYYGKNQKQKIAEIMRWNQGWIRNEDTLMAGLGLLLFPEDAKEKDPDAVSSMMKKIKIKEEKAQKSEI
jgi:hypothetical protein